MSEKKNITLARLSLLHAEAEKQTHSVTLLYFAKIRKSRQDVNTCVTSSFTTQTGPPQQQLQACLLESQN